MPTPTDLQNDPQYRLLVGVPFDKLSSLVLAYYFRRQTWIILAHYVSMTMLLIAWLLSGVRESYTLIDWFSYYGWAVLIFVGVVTVHELIHGAVYRAFGAAVIKVKILWPEGSLFVMAPDYVIGGRDLSWVIAAPFLVITFILLATLFIMPGYRYVQLGVLLLHTGACAGDFAMLNYLWQHRKHRIFVCDDEVAQIKYFYAQVEDTGNPMVAPTS